MRGDDPAWFYRPPVFKVVFGREFQPRKRQSGGKVKMLSRRLTKKMSAKMLVLAVTLCMTVNAVPAQTRKADQAKSQAEDLQKWLTYLSSDELEGRNTFSEG